MDKKYLSKAYREKNIKVLVVDGHPVVREGVEYLLDREKDMTISGFAESAEGAMENIDQETPDIIVVDFNLGGDVSGLELVTQIKKRNPKIKTFVLSMSDESFCAERAIRAGASGYLIKEDLKGSMVGAIRQIVDDKIYLSGNIESKFLGKVLLNQLG